MLWAGATARAPLTLTPHPSPGRRGLAWCVVTEVLADLSRSGQTSRNGVVGLGHSGRFFHPFSTLSQLPVLQWPLQGSSSVPGELGWENPHWLPGWLVGELVSRSCSGLPGGKGGCSTLVSWRRSLWKGEVALSKAFWPLAMEQVGAKPLVGGSEQLAQPLSGFRALGNSLSLSGLQFLHG